MGGGALLESRTHDLLEGFGFNQIDKKGEKSSALKITAAQRFGECKAQRFCNIHFNVAV